MIRDEIECEKDGENARISTENKKRNGRIGHLIGFQAFESYKYGENGIVWFRTYTAPPYYSSLGNTDSTV